MAEQKVAKLTPEEWKVLVLTNCQQLINFVQSIPGTAEGGTSGLTDEHMGMIDIHMGRGLTFLQAWRVSRIDIEPVVAMPQQQAAAAQNGAAEPKKKGGWPKGKPRAAKVSAETAQ